MEFTAVILCGNGKALFPFSETRSTGLPKALIPVANKSILTYVLDWCFTASFSKILVVTSQESSEQVQTEIDAFQNEKRLNLSLDLKDYDKSTTSNVSIDLMGITADHSGEAIYNICTESKYKIETQNFIILSCDFITNLPPQVLIEMFRNRPSNQLGITVAYRNQLDIEDKKLKVFPKKYTVYSDDSLMGSCLLDQYTKEDTDMSKVLLIRSKMCFTYPNSVISTKLLDSGIFMGSREIFDVLEKDSHKFSEAYFQKRDVNKVVRDLARRSWRHSESKETVGLLTIPNEALFYRVNNLPVWMEANRHFMKQQAMNGGRNQLQTQTQTQTQQQQSQQQSQQQIASKGKAVAHVGADSLVAESTQLGEKTNIKKSVVGSGCVIGKKVRINASLILDNVTIEDDVQLDNCIIGHNAIIHSKSKLTNSYVESTNEVVANTQSKGDTLLCLSLENLGSDVEDGEFALMSDSSSEESSSGSGSDDETSEEESEFEDEYTGNEDGLFDY
ncbi:conserved hypothetical protein [Lodderomyces elongisporus NRRL YB-4239]|uniref:Translation initiation factor eIF2B subunit gamma n=1 Tax=Lodderomyces elongisporus (strain ATCC 11503 / CBS 2605 / JCM 1781 / NBRC 1676 / NRRL YB-4239) TaxID=379508 RepID=A5E176_LODEL|nr:conserved hypothetical protein [Lodderomyces elongisporus NRRL YB-4239]